jgi:choline dehydrogenase-like flavoprotein
LNSSTATDVIILGGGLAGLMAAIRLLRAGKKVTLVDSSLPEAGGELGGFAKFSGAKFSLPPAGMGLAALAGSTELLHQKIDEVIEVLGIGSLDRHFSWDQPAQEQTQLGFDTELRSYSSIVLTPSQVDDLISRIAVLIHGNCRMIKGKATQLSAAAEDWVVTLKEQATDRNTQVKAKTVFYAAGRLESDILLNAGATQYPGKGIDIGFRVEFMQRESVRNLRDLGPDAKIMHGNCRTFCLNSPGEIYYYKYGRINIPGGVVANEEVKTANVGMLARMKNKERGRQQITESFSRLGASLDFTLKNERPDLFADKRLNELLGNPITSELQDFVNILGNLKLVNWNLPFRIHFPLIDWYWGTYCNATTHKTSLAGIYALGDSAGHARGLLQAALSGWLASEEYLYDIAH